MNFYPDTKEVMPVDTTNMKGKPVKVSVYVGAGNTGNLLTRRSHTKIIIYIYNTLINWFSKKKILWRPQSLYLSEFHSR